MTDKEKLEKLKKLADAMYYASKYLTTDASRLHKAMDEYHQFVINEYHKEEPVSEEQVKESLISKHDDKTCKENGDSLTQEPVSEDLEEASLRASIIGGQYIPKEHLDEYPYDAYAQSMFKRGANWQKEKLMAKAVDVTIAIPYKNGNGGYTQLVDSKEALPFGDNIKFLVINNKHK